MKNKIILMSCMVLGLILIPKMNVNAEASDVLRENLENRKNNIIISYEATDENHSLVVENITKEALKNTSVSTEGDYIKYHLMSDLTGRITSESFEDGKYNLEIVYSPRYLSTFEQEMELDNILNEFYNSINLDDMSAYDKLKAVYDFICDNVEYGYYNSSAYGALTNGTSNCRGYALLFYRMSTDLGFDTRIISGNVIGGNYNTYHEWNIVKIGDKYYNVDVNFGDNIGGNARYTYFLKGSNGIFKDGYGSYVPAHVRDEEFDNDEFNTEHPMSEADFNKNAIIPEEPNEPEVEVPVIPEVPEDTTEKDEIVEDNAEDNTEDDVVIEDKEDVEDTEDEIIEEDKDEEDVSDNVVEDDKEDVEDESSKEEDSNTENDKEDDEVKEDVDDKVETSNKFHGLFKKLSSYITKIKDRFFRFFR